MTQNTEHANATVDADEVTAFEVKAGDKGVDYDKLIDKYGCFKIEQ